MTAMRLCPTSSKIDGWTCVVHPGGSREAWKTTSISYSASSAATSWLHLTSTSGVNLPSGFFTSVDYATCVPGGYSGMFSVEQTGMNTAQVFFRCFCYTALSAGSTTALVHVVGS